MSRWDQVVLVQAHDTRLDQLRHRRATLPQRAELDRSAEELVALERRVGEVEAEHRELTRRQARIEDEVASVVARAERSEARLYDGTVHNPKDSPPCRTRSWRCGGGRQRSRTTSWR